MSQLRVIELIGLPGAGKSTIAQLLQDELMAIGATPLVLPDAGRVVARRATFGRLLTDGRFGDILAWRLFEGERLLRGVLFLLGTPRFSLALIRRHFGRPRAARRGRRVLYWWIRTVGARAVLLSRMQEGEVVILDEGLCHRVVQLFSSADETPQESHIKAYAMNVPLPDVLLWVDVPTDVAAHRVLERGIWERMAGEGPERVRAYLDSAKVAISLLLGSEEANAMKVVRVGNSGARPPSGVQLR